MGTYYGWGVLGDGPGGGVASRRRERYVVILLVYVSLGLIQGLSCCLYCCALMVWKLIEMGLMHPM